MRFNRVRLYTVILGGTNDGILKITGADTVMQLSDPAIKNAKSTEKPYKMPDEKGGSKFNCAVRITGIMTATKSWCWMVQN